MKNAFSFANTPHLLMAGMAILTVGAVSGQPSPGSVGLPIPQPGFTQTRPTSGPELSRFDLDFAGGTPKDLVAAIQEALRRPLNAIVPEEFATVKVPPLKMKNVTVPQLFDALGEASRQTVTYTNSGVVYTGQTSYGFSTYGFSTRNGPAFQTPATDDTIWWFYVNKPSPPPVQQVCRFYSLAPYLDHGTTVDDITTAIETGWKMLGESSPGPATIRFHKDTKLLIAVGEQSKLEIIDAVLRALAASPPPTKLAAPPPGSVPSR